MSSASPLYIFARNLNSDLNTARANTSAFYCVQIFGHFWAKCGRRGAHVRRLRRNARRPPASGGADAEVRTRGAHSARHAAGVPFRRHGPVRHRTALSARLLCG